LRIVTLDTAGGDIGGITICNGARHRNEAMSSRLAREVVFDVVINGRERKMTVA
jgi:hypothetical protein